MMLTIVLPNASSVVSSSRGCCEKTEKKTPPLSGGALIRADRERVVCGDFNVCRFSYLFSSSFFRPKRHFCDEDDGLVKTKKKKNTAALFLSSLASCLLE